MKAKLQLQLQQLLEQFEDEPLWPQTDTYQRIAETRRAIARAGAAR